MLHEPLDTRCRRAVAGYTTGRRCEVILVLIFVFFTLPGVALGFCLGAMYEHRQWAKSHEHLEAESQKLRQEWDALERDIRSHM